MAVHIHTISQWGHPSFIKEQRKDPFTKQTIQAGDQIVFCAVCKTAFLASSWETINGKHCNQQNTLQDFPAQIDFLDITKNSKNSAVPSNYWGSNIVSVIKQNIYGFLTSITQRILELMDSVEACKVHFTISTIFFPLVLVTIFWGTIWSLSIFFLTLSIVALKHFLALNNITTKDIDVFNNKALNFIIRIIVYFILLCFFSFKNIFQYIKNADDDDDDDDEFLFDFPWVLCFCLISIIVFSLHPGIYIFSVIFIVITQEILLKIPHRF